MIVEEYGEWESWDQTDIEARLGEPRIIWEKVVVPDGGRGPRPVDPFAWPSPPGPYRTLYYRKLGKGMELLIWLHQIDGKWVCFRSWSLKVPPGVEF